MQLVPKFNQQDHQTWSLLFNKQASLRSSQIIPEFSEGLDYLQITGEKIPDIQNINSRLQKATGWSGVYCEGFVEPLDFFKMLADKKFPIGSFIRDVKDLSYTPAPDVFHDLYGHIPFYFMPDYAEFNRQFGEAALQFAHSPQIIEEFQRLFWFTVEFGLLKTDNGLKIFGAGIASSFNECRYALSEEPLKTAFDLEIIRHKSFRIDIMQPELFVLESKNQLYECLGEFVQPYQEKFHAVVSS